MVATRSQAIEFRRVSQGCLQCVIEFDTRRVLDPDKGALFGVIAETSAIPKPLSFIGHEPPRFDWVGHPEQTNMRLNNPALAGTDDVRDLWNQQAPFAIAEEVQPIFRKRLLDSLTNWDMRDGKADWTPAELAAAVNVYLDDFLLFDVSKPMSDTSFLEIEKSTLHGHAYRTGGGRTVNANNHRHNDYLDGEQRSRIHARRRHGCDQARS